VIRNAVLHLHNEQPLLADLPTEPAPGDAALICTNLRTMDGKRPFFVDSSASTFVFPLLHLRFVEIPAVVASPPHGGEASPGQPSEEPAGSRTLALPAAAPAGEQAEVDDIELDEELLRRVREL
jgi:hypothetical protein